MLTFFIYNSIILLGLVVSAMVRSEIMKKKFVIILIAVVIVIAGGFFGWLFGNDNESSTPATPNVTWQYCQKVPPPPGTIDMMGNYDPSDYNRWKEKWDGQWAACHGRGTSHINT